MRDFHLHAPFEIFTEFKDSSIMEKGSFYSTQVGAILIATLGYINEIAVIVGIFVAIIGVLVQLKTLSARKTHLKNIEKIEMSKAIAKGAKKVVLDEL